MTSKVLDRPQLANELRTKLYEGLRAHCAGMGIPMVGGGFEQVVLEKALGKLASLTPLQASAMSLTNDRLVQAVAGSVNTAISQLSALQQMALRARLDPFSPAVTQAANTPGGLARLIAGKTAERVDGQPEEARSGQRFSELRIESASRSESRDGYAGAGLDGASVALFKATGLNRGVFDDLIQRATLNQIRQAAGFAGELGVSADAYAGNFVGLDEESRGDLRDFVGEMRSVPALSDDEKRRQIGVFRRAHPKLRGLSDDDMLKIVNARQKKLAQEDIAESRMATAADLNGEVTKLGTSTGSARFNAAAMAKAGASTTDAAAKGADDAFGVGASNSPSTRIPPAATPKGSAPAP